MENDTRIQVKTSLHKYTFRNDFPFILEINVKLIDKTGVNVLNFK